MELTGEIWKDIPSLEGVYQVSNFGRIKSFKKEVHGKILSIKNGKEQYIRCVLKVETQKKTFLVHRLVYSVFIGEIPYLHDIDHIDGDKQNNRVENLQCLDKKSHSHKTVAQNPNTIKAMNYRNIFRSLPVEQYSLNGELIAEHLSAKVASEKTGVCLRNIHQVASKQEYKPGKTRKQAGGYIWKYKTQ